MWLDKYDVYDCFYDDVNPESYEKYYVELLCLYDKIVSSHEKLIEQVPIL